ncbi:MAG: hypothetical protein Q7S92_03665 [Candidatus Diapherotrites archaeon]|nr:hypothetical protein [Candidatus Diapherotrites archaeon]
MELKKWFILGIILTFWAQGITSHSNDTNTESSCTAGEKGCGAENLTFYDTQKEAHDNSLFGLLVLGGTLIIIGAGFYRFKKISKKLFQLEIVLAVLILLGTAGYYFVLFPEQDGWISGPQGFAVHWHQTISVQICGQEKDFPINIGDLNRAHFHENAHRLHWHFPGWISDLKIMNLRNAFQDLGYTLNETSLQDPETKQVYRNGETICETGKENKIKVSILSTNSNEFKELEDYLDYVLQDNDFVKIEYN